MAHINLLPWREWERERRKKEFLDNLAGVLVLGGAGVSLAGMDARQQHRESERPQQLHAGQDPELDTKIAEIAQLEQQKKELEERMALIQEAAGQPPCHRAGLRSSWCGPCPKACTSSGPGR